MNKYYVYTHYRPDTQEIFYVGIGTKSKNDLRYGYYTRANSNYKRSKFWRNIVNLNPDYEVNIVLECDNYDYVKQEEIKLIKLYGRRDLNTGSLCNLTDGGEGTTGLVFDDNLRNRWSELARKRAKFGKNNHSSKSVYQYSLDGSFIKEWYSKEDCKRELGFNPSTINHCVKGRAKTAFGYRWFDSYQGQKIKPIKRGKSKQDGYLEFKDLRCKKYENVKSCKQGQE